MTKWMKDPRGCAQCRGCGEIIKKNSLRLTLDTKYMTYPLSFCEKCGLQFIVLPLVSYSEASKKDIKKLIKEVSAEAVLDKLKPKSL